MNFKRILSLLLCLVLVFSCVLPLASCKKEDDTNDNGSNIGGSTGNNSNDNNVTSTEKATYTVQVKTVGGMPLEGIMVYVHNGEGYSLCTAPKETDENGIAVFTLDKKSGYSIAVDGAPKGYNVKSGETKADRYPMDATGAVITLSSAPIKGEGFADSYKTGDVMHDFTLMDVNGNVYTLSELLKTKRMVMLNFWYRDCSNCAYEFPYINAVYEDYSEKLEILAINDYPSDTVETVKGYPQYLAEDLKMPLIKVNNTEYDLTLSRFPSEGYPTTVIIDRYGVIAMIEVGAVLGENKWQSIFSHFTADDYEQKLIYDASELTPRIEPTIQWTETSESEIAGALNGDNITVTYHPETEGADAKYSWPFIADEFDGRTVVRPSNNGIDNSFSILYATVSLKPGQAVVFDYYSSTQKSYDILYVLVDGKDIYSITGDSAEDGWSTCCTYVDPRPVLESNKDDVRTYEIAFAYYKDDFDNYGDDTVYIDNLNVIPASEIQGETYIFRYAATEPNESGTAYNTYVEVFLGDDGFYHVGSKTGPLLLANILSYTNFDPYKTVSQRIYENYEILVNGENKFWQWLTYGNAASNSQIPYYTAVTEELKEILVAYCDTYRRDVKKDNDENLWLQLCAYYDAYGVDKDGNPAPHLINPIVGLTSYSAFDVEMKEDAKYESGEIIASAEVTYNKVIMPRGYLYKFVPTVSGVYRITSRSNVEVNGWIFTGNSDVWAENESERTLLTSSDVGERYTPDLIIDKGNGKYQRDFTNVSMVAYMEAGTEYYIDIAYYDVYETGTFEFDVKWVSESFGHFIQASPGPITYIESYDGSMGDLIALGITPYFAYAAHCSNEACTAIVGYVSEQTPVSCIFCGTELDLSIEENKLVDAQGNSLKYAFNLLGYADDAKTVPVLGSMIYADFNTPTALFQTQSIEQLIIANAFNLTITEKDREALILLDNIKIDGKEKILAAWTSNGVQNAEEKWNELDLDEVFRHAWNKASVDGNYAITFDFSGTGYTAEQEETAEEVVAYGIAALKEEWGEKFAENWNDYQISDIINECLKTGQFHNTDDRSDKDIKAQEYLDMLAEKGMEGLMAYWDAEFASIIPPAGEEWGNGSESERRYNYFWDYYKMDEVANGIHHGKIAIHTDKVEKYLELMENLDTNPERNGCVAVTEELAEVLTILIDYYIFEDVTNGWLKFCYYYDILGA